MSSLPDSSPETKIVPLPIDLPSEPDLRSPQEQYWAGFLIFAECDAERDYLAAGELGALTPAEMRGYNAAIAAKDAAEYAASHGNRNSFNDLTEY